MKTTPKDFVVIALLLIIAVACIRVAVPQRFSKTVGRLGWKYKIVTVEPYREQSEESSISKARLDKLQGYDSDSAGNNLLYLSESELNTLGDEGWELVTVLPEIETTYPLQKGLLVSNTRTRSYRLLFKRVIN